MSTWLIVDPTSLTKIQALNAAATDWRQLSPTQLTDGRYVLPVDLLADCGAGQTWSAYGSILTALSQSTFDITPLLPQPTD